MRVKDRVHRKRYRWTGWFTDRIAIIGSIAGTLSSATWGPYAMTKHAMEAYDDALADEMSRFGVEISLIEMLDQALHPLQD